MFVGVITVVLWPPGQVWHWMVFVITTSEGPGVGGPVMTVVLWPPGHVPHLIVLVITVGHPAVAVQ